MGGGGGADQWRSSAGISWLRLANPGPVSVGPLALIARCRLVAELFDMSLSMDRPARLLRSATRWAMASGESSIRTILWHTFSYVFYVDIDIRFKTCMFELTSTRAEPIMQGFEAKPASTRHEHVTRWSGPAAQTSCPYEVPRPNGSSPGDPDRPTGARGAPLHAPALGRNAPTSSGSCSITSGWNSWDADSIWERRAAIKAQDLRFCRHAASAPERATPPAPRRLAGRKSRQPAGAEEAAASQSLTILTEIAKKHGVTLTEMSSERRQRSPRCWPGTRRCIGSGPKPG